MNESEMDVVGIEGAGGGPEVLRLRREPIPRPRTGEILIRVEAAGVNRPDVLQRLGHYPPPKGAPDWPGLEVAGTVEAVGEGSGRYRPGDRVMALLPGGGYARFAIAPEGSVLPIPGDLDSVHAAAIPETFFTVWHNVFQRGGLQSGERLLVHGGTSGIGTVAIQLAHARGARVAATVGGPEKVEAALRLGAELAIDYRREDFVGRLRSWGGVDLTLDMVGGDYTARNLQVAAPDGRIVQIAYLRGQRAEIDLGLVMTKRLTLTGSTLRARDVAFKAQLAAELEREVWPLLANGTVKPLIDTVYPFSKAAEAHRHMDDDHIGKIVLVPDP
ncbi:NAD(P)H-quinone oxidoreductase [Aureimonas jatrophae]|uniref:Putative NAD(P)H quinone oxidoreductase, PIG3 family n=1 Tax=Aureimonas jatrophae TaxID=1166073 RepID=A0A1H0IFI6_9HYPH|nr:NAD(P)H-quinone oxidoreductase [Aureimonas jatrophae]MBB3952142.1 NADPH2:quinone reductase [Aureimonas jatrophae]SDO30168.1 putative NAD(P)H quinone oxidoreductase, PIG3 family [Aureimonas jatrophae]